MTAEDILVLLAPPEPFHTLGWLDAGLFAGLVGACCVIVVTDLRVRIIPDGCNAVVAALGLAFAGRDGPQAAVAAFVQGVVTYGVFWAFRALYRRLRGRQGLGLGDVKFLGAAGTWVGLGGLPPLLLLACLAALAVVGVAGLRGHRISARHAIPFGPFLVFGLLCELGAGFFEA